MTTAELTDSPGTALTAPIPTDLQALFSAPDGIKAELARIKAKAIAEAAKLDVSRKKDRDALKSVAMAVIRRKTALDAAGKELNDERRKLNDAVDAERRLVRADLDKLAEELRAPVEKWEAAEEARVHALAVRLDASFGAAPLPGASADLTAIRGVVDAIPLDESWAEFLGEATAMKAKRLELLDHAIEAAVEREGRDAEIARLQKAEADRAEADRLREAAEAQAAAEREKEAAATAAALELAEKQKADLARELEEMRAAQERARQKADDDAAAAKAAEEAAAQAVRDEEARLARAAEEAKAEAERLARLAGLEAAAQATRAARFDATFAAVVAGLADLIEFTPETVATAIFAGDVPHVSAVIA